MKFMVEFRVNAGSKNKVVEAFEQRGPNRNPGVTFHGAWIGKNSDVVFALVESADESLVTSAAKSWTEFDDYRITPVIDVEQF
jgi:gamma-glutamyl-gamma-aminobutyrate hydrolase PuuD